jgi:hypothetical protein
MRNQQYAGCSENSNLTDVAGEARAERVAQRSAGELMALCEWQFRAHPFQLQLARRIYQQCQSDLTLALDAGRR